MKFIFSALVFLLPVISSATEREIGAVIAVERTYEFNLADLLAGCQNTSASFYMCKVEVASNGTEKMVSGNEKYSATINGITFYAYETGYGANIFNAADLNDAKNKLSEAFRKGKVERLQLPVVLHKVR